MIILRTYILEEKEEQQKLKKEAWKKNREDMIVSAASEWRKIMETWTPEYSYTVFLGITHAAQVPQE